jgi:hypothetical protein
MNLAKGKIEFSVIEDNYILTLEGIIDERLSFPDHLPTVGQRLIFDCAKIYMVNSIGISRWVAWNRKLHPEQQIVFRACARKVVDIINYLKDFLPKPAIVESFVLPYECVNCGHEKEDLLLRGKHYLEAAPGRAVEIRIPERRNCPKCGDRMETAVLLKNYLRFLSFLNAEQK